MAETVSSPAPPRALAWFRRFAASEHLVLWLSVIYVAVLGPFTPGLLSAGNLVNVVISLLPLFLLALGQTFVLVTGGIDLSVTSIVALASVVGATVMNQETGWLAGSMAGTPVAVILMLGVGLVIGALNGLAVARLQMPAFMVTLTGMMFFSGVAVWFTQSRNIGHLPPSFLFLGGNFWMALGIAAAAGLAAHALLQHTLFGRWLFAVGHNARAARVSGVPVPGVIVGAYMMSGLCAGLAALLLSAQAEAGSPVLGQQMLLDVVGATILGGTSLFGGRGKVMWTLGGVIFLRIADNSLNLLNLSYFTITMVKGSVILLAALLDVMRRRLPPARTGAQPP